MPQDTPQAPTTIFAARKIVTMNPSRPLATHVAVRGGRIVMVGALDDMRDLMRDPHQATLDERFADKVLLPGFVEGHAHVMEGTLWTRPYVGAFARRAPDGRLVPGAGSVEAVVARLREAVAAMPDDASPLTAWGFDPLQIGDQTLTRHDLDRVSGERPVLVHHASLHITIVNSLALERAGFDRDTIVTGVPKLADGTPSGALQGIAARLRLMRVLGLTSLTGAPDAGTVGMFAAAATIAGITTITDLHNDLPDATVDAYRKVADTLPVRLVPALSSASHQPEEGVAKIARLRALNGERLHFGLVKIVVDGSIQGFTARLRWPGYHDGSPNGLWYVAPDDLARIVLCYHRAGVQLHIHTNGDEATDAALDAIEAAQEAQLRPDHRHTLQHCQMASAAQFRRMKALGVCVNLFANHLYFWGDAHHGRTMGAERACRLDAAGTAGRVGVPYAIHSDAPVTPLGPLFTAWCAVNRVTSSGRQLGTEERINVADALHAVTLWAAYTLKFDHLVGSIEAGKFADFAVLEDDPLAVDPAALKDIVVWGTVSGGQVHQAPGA